MQEALEESVQMMKEAVDDLGATLAEAASAAGAVGGMVDSINDAINKMEDSPALDPEGTFVDYQTTMVKTAKAIAVTVQEMVRRTRSQHQGGEGGAGNCGWVGLLMEPVHVHRPGTDVYYYFFIILFIIQVRFKLFTLINNRFSFTSSLLPSLRI